VFAFTPTSEIVIPMSGITNATPTMPRIIFGW